MMVTDAARWVGLAVGWLLLCTVGQRGGADSIGTPNQLNHRDHAQVSCVSESARLVVWHVAASQATTPEQSGAGEKNGRAARRDGGAEREPSREQRSALTQRRFHHTREGRGGRRGGEWWERNRWRPRASVSCRHRMAAPHITAQRSPRIALRTLRRSLCAAASPHRHPLGAFSLHTRDTHTPLHISFSLST